MKIVQTIEIAQVTFDEVKENLRDYILVGKISGSPVIGHNAVFDKAKSFSFYAISSQLTNGNGYNVYGNEGFVKNYENYFVDSFNKGNELQAFRNEDWKLALQWLIDNC